VLLTVVGMSLFFWPPNAELLDHKALNAMRYGFLGAYTFSVQLLYRRYTTLDLQPTVYFNCAITIIVGLVFNYAAFEALAKLIGAGTDATPATGAAASIEAIVAFSLGYFPYLAITWFNQLAHNALSRRQRRSESLQLGLVDGISEFHETRLRDEGIDNLQNLSSARIDELLLNTRFTAQQVIEWVDQAILYVYLEPNEIESFRRGGVRTISDFQAFWSSCCVERMSDGKVVKLEDNERQARQAHAQQLQSTAERLDVLYKTTLEGPNIAYVGNYWKNSKDLAQEVHRYGLERQKKLTRELLEVAHVVYRTDGAGSPIGSEAIVSLISATASAFESHDGDPDLVMTRAIMADHAGEFDKAIGLYKQVIRQAPNRTDSRNNLAWLYASKLRRPEHLDEATRLVKEAIELARRQGRISDIPSLLDTLATVEIRLAENAKEAADRTRHLDLAEEYLREADRAPASERWESNPAAVQRHLEEVKALRKRFQSEAPSS
jgi:tetratricopeptide (TPR) repeat protein